MISPEQTAEIRRLFFAEHWKVGTIAATLGLHPDTVRRAVDTERFNRPKLQRVAALTDPYVDFVRQTLQAYPRLRATRVFQMVRARGYQGSLGQLRRLVSRLRPTPCEAFLDLRTFPGEQGQVDWAHFGEVPIGRARRKLSCFVLVLSWSRALHLEFFFDQSLENFLRGHVRAFHELGGVARTLLYDNLRSVVLERRGSAVHFHPRLLELCAHYHFEPRPCRPARGNEKGRVERQVRYIRESFFAARSFTTLEDFNRQARAWRDEVAHRRPWPEDDSRTIAEVFAQEQPQLLPLPVHPFDTDRVLVVRAEKRIYVRFDLNDYSIPPEAVGRDLTLVASDTTVRILDGARQLVQHRRTYDRHQQITDPAHRQALLEDKRRALGHTPSDRLLAAAPEAEALLEVACARGEPTGRQTAHLLHLLDDYGPVELRAAVREALERQSPRASSVAYILARRHRAARHRAPLPVCLDRRPDLQDLHVPTPDPEIYDELTHDADEPER
jgi:transposase